MKWLFAVLVALNIIVFGGMVASSVAEKQKQATEPAVAAATPSNPQAVQAVAAEPAVDKPAEAAASAASNTAASEVAAADEEAAKREQQAREAARLARERKARQESAKRENTAQNSVEAANGRGQQCTATANIVMNEDDYHRIKGLLNRWPHAATRTIEKRQGPAEPAPAVTGRTYRVLLPSDTDTITQMGSLAAKGFSGSLYNGDISVAVLQNQPAAQALIARLAAAGFGGAYVREQGGVSTHTGDRSLSISRMQVLFMSVDDKDAQAIQAIVGQYGKLNRNVCR